MKTLYEFSQEIKKLREAIGSIEIKGERNARIIVYCNDKCNDIISSIDEAVNDLSKSSERNNQASIEMDEEGG